MVRGISLVVRGRAPLAARVVAAALIALGALLVLAALGAGPAHAGETGGSMGGGDFSDPSPSSSSSSSSSNDDYSSPSYDYSSGSRSSGSTGDPGIDLAVALVGIVIAVIKASMKASPSMPRFVDDSDPSPSPAPRNGADVTVLRVALDARARPFVQSELARIAKTADTKTADGRATMLREVALLLRRLKDAWLYGGAVNEPIMTLGDAQAVFRRHVDDARGRFKTETVRNADGAITTAAAPELHATSDDGPGLMVVTVVVAARHELFTVRRIGDGEGLRQAFESLSTMIAGELVAVEVVWMPSAAEERLSSIALEATYPRPDLIKLPASTAGKVFCEYCGAPYPAEAISCPNCGGRAKAA